MTTSKDITNHFPFTDPKKITKYSNGTLLVEFKESWMTDERFNSEVDFFNWAEENIV